MQDRNKLKIVVISLFFFPIYPGSGTTLTLSIAKALEARGHYVKVITTYPFFRRENYKKSLWKSFSREYHGKIEVIRVWTPSLYTLSVIGRILVYVTFMFMSLAGLIVIGEADIICGISPYAFLTFPALVSRKLKQAPYILCMGDPWPEAAVAAGLVRRGFPLSLLKIISKVAFSIADSIIVTTRLIKRELMKHGINAHKIPIINRGVDTEIFQPKNKDARSNANRFGGKFTIMYSGSFASGYDIDTILKAASLLKSHDSIIFVIRGRGERSGEIINKVMRLRSKNVLIKTASADDIAEVANRINSADVLVVPLKDTKNNQKLIPSKVLEYMACGKPIVCCAKGMLAELIEKAQCGIVVEPENPRVLAKSILKLYSLNDEERAKIGCNGRKYVEEKHSNKAMGCGLEHILLKTLETINYELSWAKRITKLVKHLGNGKCAQA